jgi:hypothetical protein
MTHYIMDIDTCNLVLGNVIPLRLGYDSIATFSCEVPNQICKSLSCSKFSLQV